MVNLSRTWGNLGGSELTHGFAEGLLCFVQPGLVVVVVLVLVAAGAVVVVALVVVLAVEQICAL